MPPPPEASFHCRGYPRLSSTHSVVGDCCVCQLGSKRRTAPGGGWSMQLPHSVMDDLIPTGGRDRFQLQLPTESRTSTGPYFLEICALARSWF